MTTPVRLLGLTGGIATGKSTAARIFADLGCPVIDADQVARQVVEPGTPALAEIRAHFGAEICNADGSLQRAALAQRVFSDRSQLRHLSRIVQPRVAHAVAQQLRAIRGHTPDALVVYDVPLLFEGGLDAQVDRSVVVYIPRPLQLQRLQQRDGLSREQALLRLQAQLDIEEKARRADEVLDNQSSRAALRRQIESLMARLRPTTGAAQPDDGTFGVDKCRASR